MSVNLQQTIKPLLYQPRNEPLPAPASLSAVQGVVFDAAGNQPPRQVSTAARASTGCLFLTRIPSAENVNEHDLGVLLASGADGVVLAGCRGPADIQRIDVMLKVTEAAAGIPQGRTALLAEYATVPESVLSPHSLAGVSSRLSALIFDAAALAEACGCRRVTEAGDVPAVVRAGRAAAVLRACEAGIAAYEMMPADAVDEWALRRLWINSLENGFSAVALRSWQQIDLLAAAGVLTEV
ncbi:aldolase [Ensifer aridi]|uniref:aldolase n=1 Tax=Ensifer aridi TaxID=1708715 RepID=UPI00358F85C0